MKPIVNLLLALLITACCACSKQPETLVEGGYDLQEMEAATQRARGEVDAFIAELSKGNAQDFAVKTPVEDQGETEHFWLTGVVFANGTFEGTVDNEPGIVTNVTMGQKLKVAKADISDWMYIRDGKMYGNYTLRPLLATMPDAEAEKFRSILATP